ncbi:MAG: hypothetical protein LAT67_14645, partial [Balneolales bacterium]|nr:hypothetical protein [Balneolales bacterium]
LFLIQGRRRAKEWFCKAFDKCMRIKIEILNNDYDRMDLWTKSATIIYKLLLDKYEKNNYR